MRRFPSGTVDQVIYFVAVDRTDLKTRVTGLTTFTVYRARNGAAAAAYTTPTIAEVSSANMPGVYSLLLDEDMTLAAGNTSEEVVLHITQASMAPVTLVFEIFRPIVTEGNTAAVDADGRVDVIKVAGTTQTAGDLAALVTTVDTVVDAILVDTAVIGAAGAGLTAVPWNAAWDAEVQSEVADALAVYDPPTNAEMEARTLAAASYATAAALATVDNEIAVIDGIVDAILVDADTTIPATLATIAGYVDTEVAAIKAKTDLIPAAPAAVGDVPTAAQNATGLLDLAAGVETGHTVRETLRLMASAMVGKVSGAGTGTEVFRDVNDTKDRITASVDLDGNRTAITRDAT